MASFRTLDDVDVRGKRVLLRVDLNVPLKGEEVQDQTRIERVVPTIRELVSKGAKVILLSHLGRPKGTVVPDMTLRVVAEPLAKVLGQPVKFVETNWENGEALKAVEAAKPGDVLLLENTRFHPGEEANQPAFVRRLFDLGDIYVNDAFSAAHRAHASTEGIAHFLPSVAGRAMEAEVEALSSALEHPERPLVAVVGGAKISTKFDVLGHLTSKVDTLIIGGGMANTFLAAQGKPIGRSLCEPELFNEARSILKEAGHQGCEILLPVDAVVAEDFKPHAHHRTVDIGAISEKERILDIGPKTVELVKSRFAKAKTLVWNGPFGVFELEPFDRGTVAVAKFAAELSRAGKLRSIAGGGDTVSALNHAGVADDFTYVSTAGGAFLEWLEGKELPGVAVLEQAVAA
ncbi:phosphoglycerate kinase [Rhodoligotrophos appendicifer]|uniref:phosphoglycerate kinase n=1 Tax=Rhodoligotrophos appendicifer TaxID=987056 RepID=UPI0011852831|nr:phosphoglycerate kinase [Rhodoligotrophos appendicifer]